MSYGYALAVIGFVALVAMNVWYWRYRSGLSADERREDDAESRRDTSIW